MSFLNYDIAFLVIFTLGVIWFLWKNKKRVEREGILYIYRTQIGVKALDYIGTKYKKTLDVVSYFIVATGYFLMIFFTYYLIKTVYIYFAYPQIIDVIKAPPLMLLIPYFPKIFGVTEFFPSFYFIYFLISIIIVAIVHEGAHGIYMRRNKIKIKSTGFGFLGPILAFFVEQDEKDMTKKKIFPQLTVLASGAFANFITGILFLGILFLFFSSFYSPYGIMIAGYSTSNILISGIGEINITGEVIELGGANLIQLKIANKTYFAKEGFDITKIKDYGEIQLYQDQPAIRNGIKGTIIKVGDMDIKSMEDIKKEFSKYDISDEIILQTDDSGKISVYNIKLEESYEVEGKPVIGVGIGSQNPLRMFAIIDGSFKDPRIDYRSKFNQEFMDFIFFLLEWIILINILVALFNMLPIGIFDGGRFLYFSILAITKNEKFAQKSFKFTTIAFLLMFASLMAIWVFRRFF